jgi:hypothetical protein
VTHTSDGSTTQELKAHLPTALAQATNTVWMLNPFFKADLTREDTRIGSEEPSECLPWDRLVPQPLSHRLVSFSFSCHEVGCPCGGDRCFI